MSLDVLALRTEDEGPGYPRAAALVGGLAAAGVDVREVRVAMPGRGPDKQRIARSPWRWPGFGAALLRARGRARAALRAAIAARRPDLVLVLHPGHFLAGLARREFAGPVVLDLFLSIHDTVVGDRQSYRAGGIVARGLRWLDRRACAAAELVLLDTAAHAERVAALTALPARRFSWLPVADVLAAPAAMPYRPPRPGERLELLFFGTGVPLHGLPYLLQAVARARGVRLTLVGGTAEEREQAATLPPGSLDLQPAFVGPAELAGLLARAHLVAGVFGTSDKADRVVPFKVMHALAAGRPVLTGDSRAVRELLAPGHDCLVVPRGDAAAIARALEAAAEDPGRLAAMAGLARASYERHFTLAATGARLSGLLHAVAGRPPAAAGVGRELCAGVAAR